MRARTTRLATIAIGLMAASLMSVAPVAADTELGHSGQVGRHRLRDIFGYPGAACSYPSATAQNETSIRVRSPIVYARNAFDGPDYQLVSWRARLQERQSGVWVSIASTRLEKDYATDLFPAEFTPKTLAVTTSGLHRIRVDMYWYSPDGSSIVGRARHLVDFYAIVVNGEQVFQADDYC
jgi:hypothetical protein